MGSEIECTRMPGREYTGVRRDDMKMPPDGRKEVQLGDGDDGAILQESALTVRRFCFRKWGMEGGGTSEKRRSSPYPDRVFLIAILLCAVASPAVHAEYVMTQGKGWRLCEVLLKELQRQAPKNSENCPVDLLRSLPGVTEPEWKDLDVNRHEDLIRKLALYQGIMHGPYFDESRRTDAIAKFTKAFPKALKDEIEFARKGGIRLRVARVNVQRVNPYTNLPDSSPQTIVRRTNVPYPGYESHAPDIIRECKERYPKVVHEYPNDFIVKDDLSDIDEKRSEHVFFGDAYGNMLLFYERKEYFVAVDASGNGYTVMRDWHNMGYVGPVCSINHVYVKPTKGKSK